MKTVFTLALLLTMGNSFADDQMTQAEGVVDLDISYLELTPEEIRKRDKLLKPIYDNYENQNVSSLSNAIEEIFGMNVYHNYHNYSFQGKDRSLSNKKDVMENAVRFYSYSIDDESDFDQVEKRVLSGKDSVGIDSSNCVDHTRTKGDKKYFDEEECIYSSYLLDTKYLRKWKRTMIRGYYKKAVYTTTQNPLFEAPIMDIFVEALNNLSLKALDATVVFTNSDIYKKENIKVHDSYSSVKEVETCWNCPKEEIVSEKFKVIYPDYSKLAPIPQPIIYISKHAQYSDIEKMLKEHAPKIFSYNKLFNNLMLPSITDLNRMLSKHPNFIDDVKKSGKVVARDNLINAMKMAMLDMAYGTAIVGGAVVTGVAAVLAAPVPLSIILTTPKLYSLFVSQVIIFL